MTDSDSDIPYEYRKHKKKLPNIEKLKVYHGPPADVSSSAQVWVSGVDRYPIKAQWLQTTGQLTFVADWKADGQPESRWRALDGDKRWVALGYEGILGIFTEPDNYWDGNVVYDLINLCDIVSVKPCKSPQHTSFEIQGSCTFDDDTFPIYFKFETASAYERKEWIFFIKQAMGLNVLNYLKNENENQGDEKKDEDEDQNDNQENTNLNEEKENKDDEKDSYEDHNNAQDDAANAEANEEDD